MYTAVVLNNISHTKLLQHFAWMWEDEPGWETVAHHMTMNMGSCKERKLLGDMVSMSVTAVGECETAIACAVRLPSEISTDNDIAHITLAVNRGAGGKPVHSNRIKTWEPIEEKFYVSGIVEEIK